MNNSKKFSFEIVVTAAGQRNLFDGKMGEFTAIMADFFTHIYGKNVMDYESAEAGRFSEKYLYNHFTWLQETVERIADAPKEFFSSDDYQTWLSGMKRKYGAMLEVPYGIVPEHVYAQMQESFNKRHPHIRQMTNSGLN